MGTRYRIHDLKSSNGVFVNGARWRAKRGCGKATKSASGRSSWRCAKTAIQQFAEEGLRLDVVRLNKWVGKGKNLLQDISLSILPQELSRSWA